MFYGRGAGGDPTASAILGDVVVESGSAPRQRARGRRVRLRRPACSADGCRVDRVKLHQPRRRRSTGVLAAVAATFAEHDVSIETVRQRPGAPGSPAMTRRPARPLSS